MYVRRQRRVRAAIMAWVFFEVRAREASAGAAGHGAGREAAIAEVLGCPGRVRRGTAWAGEHGGLLAEAAEFRGVDAGEPTSVRGRGEPVRTETGTSRARIGAGTAVTPFGSAKPSADAG